MNNAEFQERYQEYADQCAVENGDLYNTSAFGRHLNQSPVWENIDRLKAYNEKLLAKALQDLKQKQEWQDLEADDIRHKASGDMSEMKAFELLDRYIIKIRRSYKAEDWYHKELNACDMQITSLKRWQTTSKSKARRLKHWRERRIMLERGYATQTTKTNRYERLIYKWLGICDVIRQDDIAHEIAAERAGNGNKYGFNPNIQSRETATGIFED